MDSKGVSELVTECLWVPFGLTAVSIGVGGAGRAAEKGDWGLKSTALAWPRSFHVLFSLPAPQWGGS